jgi:hypothetical protein
MGKLGRLLSTSPKNFFLLPVFICVDLCSSVVSFRCSTSKQTVLLAGRFEAEVLIGKSGGDAAAHFRSHTFDLPEFQ